MRFQLVQLGIVAWGCAACSGNGDPSPPEGSGGSGAVSCDTDFTGLASQAPVSLRTDVMPIFGLSCAAKECHNSADKKAELFLGPKCVFDDTAKWKCVFPTAPDPDPAKAQPLTEADVALVYADLMEASKTAPSVMRVVAGSPQTSFLVDKVVNKQNEKGYTDCTNQDLSKSQDPCGTWMPLVGDSLCDQVTSKGERTGQAKVDAIAAWIAQGAQNN